MKGDGANAKSARALLRHNVFDGHWAPISSEAFQEETEFRKQGKEFAFARCVTIQECDPGKPLVEEVFQKFVSGEFLSCRPLFGKATTYYRWSHACKYWESNATLPSIKGDADNMNSLRAFTRRIRVVEVKSTFTSTQSDFNEAGRVFREDADLTGFLESPEAKLAYLKRFLIPFIEEHSLQQTKDILLCPPNRVVENTQRLVAQMANGGLSAPDAYKTAEEEIAEKEAAEKIIRKAFVDAGRQSTVSYTQAPSLLRSVPGTFRSSTKGKHLV